MLRAAGWGGCPGQDSTEPYAFGCPACVWVLQSLCTSLGWGGATQNLSQQAGEGYLPVSLVIHGDKIHEEHVVSHGVHAKYLHLEGGEHAPAAEQREGRAELSQAEGPQGAPKWAARGCWGWLWEPHVWGKESRVIIPRSGFSPFFQLILTEADARRCPYPGPTPEPG